MTKRLLLLGLLAFGVACQKAPAPQPPATPAKPATATQAAQQAQAPAPQVKPVPEKLPATIARVNGEAIGKDEFERALRNLEARAGQPVPAEKRSEVYRGLLDQMIAYKLLLQQSKTLKVTITESEVDNRIKQIRETFPNEQAFTKALTDQRVTLEQLRNDQREQLLVAKVLDAEVNWKVNVTPKDVDDFYALSLIHISEPTRPY